MSRSSGQKAYNFVVRFYKMSGAQHSWQVIFLKDYYAAYEYEKLQL
jgi:hypothetical protein